MGGVLLLQKFQQIKSIYERPKNPTNQFDLQKTHVFSYNLEKKNTGIEQQLICSQFTIRCKLQHIINL